MKNIQGKIANITNRIDPNCSSIEKEIIIKYWKITEGFDWVNKIKTIKEDYDLPNNALVKIIQDKSTFSLYAHCNSCNSFEFKTLSSRSKAYTFFCEIKRSNPIYKCDHCKEKLRVKHEKEEQERAKKEERFQKLVQLKAIENKAWINLSKFDQIVLKNCIDFNDFEDLKRYYREFLGKESYKNLFQSLKALREKRLIKLILDTSKWDFWIIDFSFLPELNEQFTIESSSKENNYETFPPVISEQSENELKMRLTIDSRSTHFDKPRFGGTIKFPTDILLNKDVKYSFAAWEKAGNEFHLTFIPVEKTLNKPIQRRILEEPKHIQDVIDDIFDEDWF